MNQEKIDKYLQQRKKRMESQDEEVRTAPSADPNGSYGSADKVNAYLKRREERISASKYEQKLRERDKLVWNRELKRRELSQTQQISTKTGDKASSFLRDRTVDAAQRYAHMGVQERLAQGKGDFEATDEKMRDTIYRNIYGGITTDTARDVMEAADAHLPQALKKNWRYEALDAADEALAQRREYLSGFDDSEAYAQYLKEQAEKSRAAEMDAAEKLRYSRANENINLPTPLTDIDVGDGRTMSDYELAQELRRMEEERPFFASPAEEQEYNERYEALDELLRGARREYYNAQQQELEKAAYGGQADAYEQQYYGEIPHFADFRTKQEDPYVPLTDVEAIKRMNGIGGDYTTRDRMMRVMRDEELATMTYLRNTQGEEAAEAYFKQMQPELQTRLNEGWSKWGDEHPVIGSAVSVAQGMGNAVKGTLYTAGNAVGKLLGKDGEIDPYHEAFQLGWARDATREGVMKDMGAVGRFLYQTGMSVADSTTQAALLGGMGGAAMLAGGAMTDTVRSIKLSGGSDEQAMTMGVIAGGAELLTEKMGFDRLGELIGGNKGNVVREILGHMTSEFGEEAATEIANIMADGFVMADKSEYQTLIRQYMQEGMSEQEARKKALTETLGQVGLSGLGGALSGAVMGGGSAALGKAFDAMAQRETARMQTEAAAEDAVRTQVQEAPESDLEAMQRITDGMDGEQEGQAHSGAEEPKAPVYEPYRADEAEGRTEAKVPQSEARMPEYEPRRAEIHENVTADEARVHEIAAQYGEDARVFEAHYEGGDAEVYRRGFSALYTAGKLGLGMEQVQKAASESIGKMSEAQRAAIWQAGRNSVRNKITAGVVKQYTQKLNNDQRAQIRILQELGRTYNLEFDVVDSVGGRVQGGYIYGSRRIVVALDAMENAYVQTGVHEMVHYVKSMNSEAYDLLQNTVLGHLQENGEFNLENEIRRRAAQYAGRSKSREDLIEEIICEAVPTVFTDRRSVEYLAKQHPTLAQKISDFFKTFVAKLTKIAQKYAAGQRREEIRALLGKKGELLEIAATFDKALEAVKDKQTIESDSEYKKDAADAQEQRIDGEETKFSRVDGVEFVQNKYYARLLDKIEEQDVHGYLKVGKILDGSVLNQVGLPKGMLYFDVSKIRRALDEHGDHLSVDVLKQIPDALRNPIVITAESSGRDINVFSELSAGDAPLLIGIVVTHDRSGRNTITKIRTIHARRNAIQKISDENILYLNPDKKKTREWFQAQWHASALRGTSVSQLEKLGFGVIRSIAENELSVNGAVRYSLNNRYSYDALVSKPDMRIVEIDTDGSISRDETIRMGRENAESNAQRHDVHGTPMVYVEDLGKYVSVGNKALGHGLDGKRLKVQAPVITRIGDILKNSIVVNEAEPKKSGVRNSWVLLGTARVEEDIVYVRSIINQSTGHLEDVSALYAVYGKKNRTSRNVSAERVKAEALQPSSGPSGTGHVSERRLGESLGTASSSNISIAELLTNVNGLFDDVISQDVAQHLGIERSTSEFTSRLRYSLKTPADEAGRRILSGEVAPEDVDVDEGSIRQLAEDAMKHRIGERLSEKLEPKIGNAAAQIIRDTESSYGRAKLAQKIREMIGQYAEGKEDGAALQELCREIIAKSAKMDTSHREGYEDVRRRLREDGISLTQTQKQEAANSCGSYNDFRRSVFGSVKITEDGTSLDRVWQELSEKHPEMFPADTGEAEMVAKLVEFTEVMQPRYVNPSGMDTEAAAQELALRIEGDVIGLLGAKNIAQKKYGSARKFAEEYRKKYDEQLAEQRRERVERFQKIARDLKAAKERGDGEAQKRIMQEYRAANRKERLGAAYKEAEAIRSAATAVQREKAEMQSLTSRVVKQANALMKMMTKPEKGKHVPTHLQPLVIEILEMLDINSMNAAKKGSETKTAQTFREKLEGIRNFYQNVWEKQSAGETPDGLNGLMMTLSERNMAQIVDAAEVIERGEKYVLREMSSTQLKSLEALLKTIKHTVENVGKLWRIQRYENVIELGDASIDEMQQRMGGRDEQRLNEMRFEGKVRDFAALQMLEPVSFGERLGEGGKAIIQGLLDGEKEKFAKVREAAEATERMKKDCEVSGYDIGKWQKHIHRIELPGGRLVRMTDTQIMSLYLTAKRPQGLQHLLGNGMKVQKTEKISGAKHIRLTQNDIHEICNRLTDKQREMADIMQRYLAADVAKWGNDVTQRMYLYDAFTEEHYFPLSTDPNTVKSREPEGERAFNAIVNAGFTKPVNQMANDPLVISDVFDVFGGHIGEMAAYAGYAEVLTDTLAWLNYKQRDGEGMLAGSVKESIEQLLGSGGIRYITNLVQDINQARRGGDNLQITNALLGKAKKAAVVGKIKVAIQQPTSIVRAAAEINPIYLIKGIKAGKGAVEEMQKWSALAWWKGHGNYDTGIGKGMNEILWGKTSRKDAAVETAAKVGALGLDPGKMDDWAWARMWSAVKREISRTRSDLEYGSDEYFKAVAARFEYICDRTQVVDTVMHRSQIMRGKDGWVKNITAFMSEPTKSYNMMMRAIMDVGRDPKNPKKYARMTRVAAVYTASAMLTAAMTALHDAFKYRDDEEDIWTYLTEGGFGEDWAQQWLKGFLSNVNPLENIVLVADLWDMAMGGDAPQSMAMTGFSDLFNAFKVVHNYYFEDNSGKRTKYGIAKPVAQAISTLTGMPISGVMANAETVGRIFDPKWMQTKSEMYTAALTYDALYKAIIGGDKKKEESIRTQLRNGMYGNTPKSLKEISTGISDVLAMEDERVLEAFAMRNAGNRTTELVAMRKAIRAGGFTEDEVNRAINTVESKYQNMYKMLLEEGKTEEAAAIKAKGEKYGIDFAAVETAAKDLDEKLKAKSYEYKHLYTTIRNGSVEDIGIVAEIMESESSAKDPAKSIKSEVTGEFKAEYVGYIKSGNVYAARQLARKLAVFGIDDEDLAKWVKDSNK